MRNALINKRSLNVYTPRVTRKTVKLHDIVLPRSEHWLCSWMSHPQLTSKGASYCTCKIRTTILFSGDDMACQAYRVGSMPIPVRCRMSATDS